MFATQQHPEDEIVGRMARNLMALEGHPICTSLVESVVAILRGAIEDGERAGRRAAVDRFMRRTKLHGYSLDTWMVVPPVAWANLLTRLR